MTYDNLKLRHNVFFFSVSANLLPTTNCASTKTKLACSSLFPRFIKKCYIAHLYLFDDIVDFYNINKISTTHVHRYTYICKRWKWQRNAKTKT